jgi:hypothetical protein
MVIVVVLRYYMWGHLFVLMFFNWGGGRKRYSVVTLSLSIKKTGGKGNPHLGQDSIKV